MTLTKTITIENDEGDEITYEWPAMYAVCSDCEGYGMVLTESIRQHAYSAEEFAEAFDDEEREEYFKRGGRYDVQCPTCRGERVEVVLDVDRIRARGDGDALDEYYQQEQDRRQDEMNDRWTRRMENGGYE